ncbi:MAG: cytidine deaminase [Saprospiraceae bacterium]|nr:cytidine deaminase [Saprospiraceae bacterium]
MREIRSETIIKIISSVDELTEQDKELISTAESMLKRAYAPYSHFHVGAAVRLTNGEIYVGCNQENASYPLCMCGERVALYNAGANRPDVPVETLAILVQNQKQPVPEPASPCGACRQVIYEFEMRHNHPIRILLKADGKEIYEIPSGKHLLPMGFDSSFL